MSQAHDTTATPKGVLDNATHQTKSDLKSLILLGTFGAADNMKALLRLSNGTIARVGTGDRIGPSTVVAVEDGRLALARNGKASWLAAPQR